MAILTIIFVYWVLMSTFGLVMNIRTFRKYSKRRQVEVPSSWSGLTRNDYDKWNKKYILLGSILFFPWKALILIHLLVLSLIMISHVSLPQWKSIFERLRRPFMNVYGKFFLKVVFNIEEEFSFRNINTPMVISNHVSWFDIFYILYGFYPVSFVSKEEVKKFPVIGSLAKSINCVFIKRKSAQDRQSAVAQIKQRIQDNISGKQSAYPVFIFPEGTTSNGEALLKFKNGAFQNLCPITVLCLHYSCQNFAMGMDEIQQAEHLPLVLSQRPKLKAKKFTVTAEDGQSVDEYKERVRKMMGKVLGYKLTEGGYREKLDLDKLVDSQVK